MRVLITAGSGADREEFLAGWRSLNLDSQITVLTGSDLFDSPTPIFAQLGDKTGIISPEGYSTAPLAGPLQELLLAAQSGPVTVVAGPTLMHDGGAGALAKLSQLELIELRRWGSNITVAVVETAPLLGLSGRGAQLAASGKLPDAAERELAIGAFAHRIAREWEANLRLARAPGSGMAGGLAFLLAAAGASLCEFSHAVAEKHAWRSQLAECDLVIGLSTATEPMALLRGVFACIGELAEQCGAAVAVVSNVARMPRRHLAVAGITDHYCLSGRGFFALGRSLAATWSH